MDGWPPVLERSNVIQRIPENERLLAYDKLRFRVLVLVLNDRYASKPQCDDLSSEPLWFREVIDLDHSTDTLISGRQAFVAGPEGEECIPILSPDFSSSAPSSILEYVFLASFDVSPVSRPRMGPCIDRLHKISARSTQVSTTALLHRAAISAELAF